MVLTYSNIKLLYIVTVKYLENCNYTTYKGLKQAFLSIFHFVTVPCQLLNGFSFTYMKNIIALLSSILLFFLALNMVIDFVYLNRLLEMALIGCCIIYLIFAIRGNTSHKKPTIVFISIFKVFTGYH